MYVLKVIGDIRSLMFKESVIVDIRSLMFKESEVVDIRSLMFKESVVDLHNVCFKSNRGYKEFNV